MNGHNLAFLIGAEGVGKTTYVENNLDKFKKMKSDISDRNKKQQLP